MTYNIQVQVFQKFIQGPKQLTNTNGGYAIAIDEKAASHTELLQDYEDENDEIANAYDRDMPYYEVIERYDYNC